MKPLTLKLRGAVGIHDGLGQDDISIDFGGFQSGLIALVGPNGSGKTTILENLHPYLQLASREGSLSNHFRLRDSFRDFTFELAGHTYRSYVLIDAKTAKTEAYLYRDGQPLNDGKVNTYKGEIEKLLGSPELFFRSIFSCQNAESITSLTAGKRKDLFLELLGLQRYDLYAEHCKLQGDIVEKDIALRRAKLEQINTSLAKRSVVAAELEKIRKDLQKIDKEVKEVQDQIDAGMKELSNRDRSIVEDKQKGVQVHDLGNEISVLESRRWKLDRDHNDEKEKIKKSQTDIEQEIGRKEQIVQHKHDIEQNVIRLQALRLQGKGLEERKAQLVEVEKEESKAEMEYRDAVHRYQAEISETAGAEQALETEKRTLVRGFDNQAQEAERFLIDARRSSSLITEVPCNTVPGLPEQCKLLTSALTARDNVGLLVAKIVELKSDPYRWENGLRDLEERYKVNAQRKRALVEPTNHVGEQFTERKRSIGYDAGQHSTVKREIETLEGKKWEPLLEELRIAEATIEEKKKALSELTNRLIEVSKKYHEEVLDLDAQIKAKREKWETVKASLLSPEFHKKFEELKNAVAKAQNELKIIADQRSILLGDIQFREEMLKELDDLSSEAKTIEEESSSVLRKLESWRLLQRACSKDGIPALELDAAGPAVSRIANDLLASAFGTRFQISFETTKMSKDNKKQLETFEIRVYGEDGEKSIEDLSGGQRVWIEKAIQEAIAIYLSEKSGKEYLTSYADESDGALDPENKEHFLAMLRESFKLGRRHFTFLITQTPEIWQQIQQRIHLVPAGGKLEFIY